MKILIFSLLFFSCSHKKSNQDYSKPVSYEVHSGAFYYDWPVDRARFTRGFSPKRSKPHLGVDLAAPKGTPILAAQKGTVIYTGRDFRGFGKMILIESSHGWASLYAHLDRIKVTEGQKVAQGEVIGTMGNTGRTTGTHLHFEIRRNKLPVDPMLYLPSGHKVANFSN
jgi:murein DD-endopeptidase MepM/ murein hydrolase activator NlpD